MAPKTEADKSAQFVNLSQHLVLLDDRLRLLNARIMNMEKALAKVYEHIHTNDANTNETNAQVHSMHNKLDTLTERVEDDVLASRGYIVSGIEAMAAIRKTIEAFAPSACGADDEVAVTALVPGQPDWRERAA